MPRLEEGESKPYRHISHPPRHRECVSDGDTVTAISANSTRLRIRVLGIDAPEIPHGSKPGQPFGEEGGTTSII